MTLRQLIRSMRENGGSLKTFCGGEDAKIANGLADLISAFHLVKEAPQPHRRNIALRRSPCKLPCARAGSPFSLRSVPKIWTADFHPLFAQELRRWNGMRVGFLTGGAARHPDANGRRPCCPVASATRDTRRSSMLRRHHVSRKKLVTLISRSWYSAATSSRLLCSRAT